MAKYMRDRVPGMSVPQECIERMADAVAGIDEGDKKARAEAWRTEGIQLCIEQIQEIRQIEGVAGVHISAIEWESAIKPLVEGAGLLPRPPMNG